MPKKSLDEFSFERAPKMVTSLPGPKSREMLKRQEELEGAAVSYPRGTPVAFERGKGATIRDMDGNIFIDFFGGAGVLQVGHCNPWVVEAVKEQLDNLTHSLDFPTPPRAELVEELMEVAPGDMRGSSKVLFGGPTGSDAVESSVKLAKHNTNRIGLVAFMGSYHGMTSGALALTADKHFKRNYLPLIPEVHFIPYAYCYRCAFGMEYPDCGLRCAEYLRMVLENPNSGVVKPAAVILEPIQGEGGSVTPPEEYLPRLKEITAEHDIPLIFDEIQSGMGRTGKMWSCQHSGTTPDIMTISKGIGGGLPLSAIMYRDELDTWKAGAHIGTFRGHVTAMAAGAAGLKFMKEYDLPNHAYELGEHMVTRLKDASEDRKHIGDARGSGLMIGVEFVKDKEDKKPYPEMAKKIRLEAYKRGVIVELGGHYGNVIRFLPPLVLTEHLADNGVNAFLEAVKALE
ncbi:MAG: aspartate aminotransferase family protein [Candidatus Bathyarchaeota archaeon]|jgi:diaminobutyrate-2-oxoglutarate transaminase